VMAKSGDVVLLTEDQFLAFRHKFEPASEDAGIEEITTSAA